MRILAIETSCDETAVAIVDAEGTLDTGVSFTVLSNIIHSQVELHAEYGGVYPTLAKREHGKNLVPILEQALREAGMLTEAAGNLPVNEMLLAREPELLAALKAFLPQTGKPAIDAIAVTHGPGLEPALWVGINFAKALAEAWNIPVIPVNHMEGHFLSALLEKNGAGNYRISHVRFPMLALLVSGGHTELVLSNEWLAYKLVGETRDDAAGEAFDKAARLLGLAYPGGPEIAKRAANVTQTDEAFAPLPRPMLASGDYDFSFSGLKTAVRYRAETMELTPEIVSRFAYEFQEAVTDVLVSKTLAATQETGAQTIAVGGGVSANKRLREKLTDTAAKEAPETEVRFAPFELTGDNALMIAVCAYIRKQKEETPNTSVLRAQGTLQLAS